jgi:outer membrane lipoprotein-sorting protein
MNKRTRTYFIAFVLLLSVASVSLVAAMMIPSADELLTTSVETLKTATNGHARFEVAAEFQGETRSGAFEAWGKREAGPNGEPALHIEVLDASKSELIGLTAVSDGTQFWLYDPQRNTVVVGQAEDMAAALAEKFAEHEGEWQHDGAYDPETADIPETPEEMVAKFLEYFTAERDGTEQVAQSDAYKLLLVPIPEKMPDELRLAGGVVNLWLRDSDQLPLAAEYAGSSAGYGKIEASLAEINIVDLDESLFSFSIPDGAEVIEATDLLAQMEEHEENTEPVDFEVLTPGEVPESAVPAETSQLGGTVVQRFTLPEGRSFVVAQGYSVPSDAPAEADPAESVVVRGLEGTIFTNDEANRSLLVWQEGELFFMVGGDVSPEQALAIAESLQ